MDNNVAMIKSLISFAAGILFYGFLQIQIAYGKMNFGIFEITMFVSYVAGTIVGINLKAKDKKNKVRFGDILSTIFVSFSLLMVIHYITFVEKQIPQWTFGLLTFSLPAFLHEILMKSIPPFTNGMVTLITALPLIFKDLLPNFLSGWLEKIKDKYTTIKSETDDIIQQSNTDTNDE